jgi:hypothetical protein
MKLKWPALSLVIFQTCTVAGLPVAEKLTDTAMECVRSLTFEVIAADQISCLSDHVLETILQHDRMVMTEYDRFQILQVWVEAAGNSPIDRHATGANLSKYIVLEVIDPIHLSSTITASGLVTVEKYTRTKPWPLHQRRNQKECSMSIGFAGHRIPPPPNNEPPAKVKVEGAGKDAVNGVYKEDRVVGVYTKQGMYEGIPCNFIIYEADNIWYISVSKWEHEEIDIYKFRKSEVHVLPPCKGWELEEFGDDPPPVLLSWVPNHNNQALD